MKKDYGRGYTAFELYMSEERRLRRQALRAGLPVETNVNYPGPIPKSTRHGEAKKK